MATTPFRVLMVDDHPIVLAGLKTLVNADPDFEVVGAARDGRSALRLAKELLPDIVVLDISLPEMNGIEVAMARRQSMHTKNASDGSPSPAFDVETRAVCQAAARLTSFSASVVSFSSAAFSSARFCCRTLAQSARPRVFAHAINVPYRVIS